MLEAVPYQVHTILTDNGWGVERLLQRCDTQERYGRNANLAVFRRKLEAELTPQLTLF
jgi:hypothetical protein